MGGIEKYRPYKKACFSLEAYMNDRRGITIETIDPEASEVILADGEVIAGNVCDRILSAEHLAVSCVDHYKPWV
jgi:hypothetical protein